MRMQVLLDSLFPRDSESGWNEERPGLDYALACVAGGLRLARKKRRLFFLASRRPPATQANYAHTHMCLVLHKTPTTQLIQREVNGLHNVDDTSTLYPVDTSMSKHNG